MRRPPGYHPRSSSTTAVDGVDWFQQVGGSEVTWTAVLPRATARNSTGSSTGNSQYVELSVPRTYPAQAAYLVDVGAPLRREFR